MKHFLSLLICLLLFSFDSKSQSKQYSTSQQFTIIETFDFPEIDNFTGTYQFIVKEKKNFLLTTETFQLIETTRKDAADISITLNDYLDVFIPSKQTISQNNFQFFSNTYILK